MSGLACLHSCSEAVISEATARRRLNTERAPRTSGYWSERSLRAMSERAGDLPDWMRDPSLLPKRPPRRLER